MMRVILTEQVPPLRVVVRYAVVSAVEMVLTVQGGFIPVVVRRLEGEKSLCMPVRTIGHRRFQRPVAQRIHQDPLFRREPVSHGTPR